MTIEELIAKLNELSSLMEQPETDLAQALEYYNKCVTLAEECLLTLNKHKGEFKVINTKTEKLTDDNDK